MELAVVIIEVALRGGGDEYFVLYCTVEQLMHQI